MAKILFKNAHLVMVGQDKLQAGYCVLVEENRITAVTQEPLVCDDATVIDVGGKTLMPGLIDAHAHVTGLTLSPKNISSPPAEIFFAAAQYLKNSLMAGFTTVREAGGADYVLAQMLNKGEIIGPRLFYSGKALTETGGGADFRQPFETFDPCGHIGPFSVMSTIADGVPEVRRAAREELRKGATQLKVFVSGGVVFPSKAHATLYEYSIDELCAIVEEANARETYVMAHVYTDAGVRRCLQAGVRSIEHANFISEETVDLMAESGACYDPTFISLVQRIESATETGLSPQIVENLKTTTAAGQQVYQWAKARNVPIGFGTDLWGPQAQAEQLREFEMRKDIDTPANILASATHVNAFIMQQTGKLGCITEGAYADILIVEGDPLSDWRVMVDYQHNLKLIMKDGVIYKNELTS